MIYAQLRENEKTARYEVKVIAGNKCEPVVESAETSASSTPTKSRTTKKAAETNSATEWRIGTREEPCWVDLEAELRHMIVRAPIDFGINSAEKSNGLSGAGSELMQRLNALTDDLYRIEAMESFMQYLSILNIFEYLRIVAALDRVDANNAQASQVGIIGPEYFAQRKIALQLDLAELTEWLVAHGIGLPDLSIFYPARFGGVVAAPAAAPAPKKKGRKKAGDAEAEASAEEAAEVPQTPIPEALNYVVEMIRLQQATLYDLVKFVDDIQQRNKLETPRAAIEMMQRDAVQWLDVDHFATIYESAKKEEQLATMRQQAALERQRQAFEAKPRRGAKSKHEMRNERGSRNKKDRRFEDRAADPSPLEEFASSFDEDGDDAYEQAMQRAIERPEGFEFVPEELLGQDHGNGVGHDDEEQEDPEERKRRQRERILGINAARREREGDESEAGSHNLFSEADFEMSADDFDHGDDDEHPHDDREDGEEGDDREPGAAPRPRVEGQGDRDEADRRRRRPRSRRGGRGRDDRRQGGGADRPREDRGPRPERRERQPQQPRAQKERPPRRRGGGGLDYDEVQPVSNYTPGLPVSAQPGAIPPPPSASRGQGGGAGKPKRRWRGRR